MRTEYNEEKTSFSKADIVSKMHNQETLGVNLRMKCVQY